MPHLVFFFFFFLFPDTCQLKPNRSYRVKPPKHTNSSCTGVKLANSSKNSKPKKKKKNKTKQNKKKAQNILFELNNKTLNYLNSQNAPFFSLQLSLTFCSPSPLSHRRTRSLPKTHSHSPILCMTLSLKLTSPHQPTLNSGIKLIKAFNLSFSILSSLYSHML